MAKAQKSSPTKKKSAPEKKSPPAKKPAAPAKPATVASARKTSASKKTAPAKPVAKKPAAAKPAPKQPAAPAAKKTSSKKLPAKKSAPKPAKKNAAEPSKPSSATKAPFPPKSEIRNPKSEKSKSAAKKTAPKPDKKSDVKPAKQTGATKPPFAKPQSEQSEQSAIRSPKSEIAAAPPAPGGDKRKQLRNRILNPLKLVAFTLDEALEIAKQHAAAAEKADDESPAAKAAAQQKEKASKLAKAAAPTHVKAASLADILGFNPKKAKPTLFAPIETIPEKYRRYYKLLLDLRASLTEGLAYHTENTLRRSSKDDAGDLSSYGQHMADAGTDTFDRDFALSMVASEQEALGEIDAAIKRIQTGSYGICEITNKPIAKERLLAVPFTRYSAEAQKDLERNRMRIRTAAGLFGGEIGSDDATRVDDSGGEE